MKVKVNHKRVSLPFVSLGVLSVVQEGYSVVVRTNLGEFKYLNYFLFYSKLEIKNYLLK
jgi:hypothetical protein